MNENVKKYLTYGGRIVLVIAMAAFVWLLFRDNRTAPDADQRAGQYIEQTAEQQRKAESEIAAVRKGIDSAQQSAADIAGSNSGSAAVVGGIADSQQSAQVGITDAEKSADRIEDQSDRIAEAGRRAEINIKSAEAANQSAARALERALQLCRECRELNTGSESIIGAGQTGNDGGSEGTREN